MSDSVTCGLLLSGLLAISLLSCPIYEHLDFPPLPRHVLFTVKYLLPPNLKDQTKTFYFSVGPQMVHHTFLHELGLRFTVWFLVRLLKIQLDYKGTYTAT